MFGFSTTLCRLWNRVNRLSLYCWNNSPFSFIVWSMDGVQTTVMDSVAEVGVPRGATRVWLWAEMMVVFIGAPGLLFFIRESVRGLIIPLIMLAGMVCWLILRKMTDFDRSRLWNGRDFVHHIARSMRVFIPLGIFGTAFSYWYEPERFLSFPLAAPQFWLMVMILYPVLSAYPQELVYRVFFMQRYSTLFPRQWQMILASALFFGWAHAFLGNWIAPVFTTLGGILFAHTYLRSKSLLQTAIEHGIYGDLLFTVGIGWHFYAGSIG